MSDLVKRLDQALHFEDWMPVPENFSEAVPLLQESRNRIEELEAHCKRLRLEAAHANDTADAAIERAKELEAALPEQIKWVKRLADDLIAAEGREARLKDKLAVAVAALSYYANHEILFQYDDASFARDTIAELEGDTP